MILATPQAMAEVVRQSPERTSVRAKINQGPWEMHNGTDFLDLWEQPFAGTIYVDAVYVDGSLELKGVGEGR